MLAKDLLLQLYRKSGLCSGRTEPLKINYENGSRFLEGV